MKSFIVIQLIISAALLVGCSSNKDVAYLQNMREGSYYPYEPKHEIILQQNDQLSITVTCPEPELAVPFNSSNGAVTVSGGGSITTVSDGGRHSSGYHIDSDGNIFMPILGKINAEGMYIKQLEDVIRTRIIQGGYIRDPQVSVELLNFKYTVLGAVNHNGTFNADGERVTLFEAIAKAGDITDKGDHSKVAVIREVDGKVLRIDHDLRKVNVLNSPHYYLQPNDIVYVEPKYKKQDGESKSTTWISIFLGVISTACTVIWAIK